MNPFFLGNVGQRKYMTQKDRDAGFLREFHDYASHGPEVIAELISQSLYDARNAKDFDRVGHLQARLHAEMVVSMETAAAHMYAYSNWNSPEGVLGTLVSYRHRELHQFLERLLESSEPLATLKLPEPEAVRDFAEDPKLFDEIYANKRLVSAINSTCGMLRNKTIRDAYNRIKHASVYTRHLAFLKSNPDSAEKTSAVKILHKGENSMKFDVDELPVAGQKSVVLTNTYLNNIHSIMSQTRDLAGFVAFSLENDLMKEA